MNYNEPRDAISHDWISLFINENLRPVLIPNCGDEVEQFLQMNDIQAVILSNGNDIYDQNRENSLKNVSLIRDYTERNILTWARNNQVRILGVCRGLQLINMVYGGSLEYDLGEEHIKKEHVVKINDYLTQKHFETKSLITNSFHNQGIKFNNLAKGLVPFATTADGIIEGFYARTEPILAIQWHPERELTDSHLNKHIPIDFLINGPWWLG